MEKTRKANLILLLLTGLSWFGLGIFYGWGYCPLTDWHWKVLRELGETGLPNSYVSYLINRMLSLNFSDESANLLTVSLYFIALVCSLFVNFAPRFKKKRKSF